MNEKDQADLEKRRRYDEWVEFFEKYYSERGLPEGKAHEMARFTVWWSGVLAKANGWFVGVVAGGFIVSALALALTLAGRDILHWLRGA